MKEKTPEQKIVEYRENIVKAISHWKNINTYGCNDPAWPDGCNMNLVRNHIIYYKYQIAEICEENSLPLPEEYFLPLPPEVDDNYMANLKQTERVRRLQAFGTILKTGKVKYKEEQLSLF